MGLLSFWPESLSTINIISGYYLGLWPVLVIIGLFLIVFSVVLLKNRFAWLPDNNNDRLMLLFFAFWLILLVGFTSNNYNEWSKNKDYKNYDLYHKSIMRICGLDNQEGNLCRVFSVIARSRKEPSYEPPAEIDSIKRVYLNYYSFPDRYFPN